jgi:trehalose/maltose hydrolase-like predicted phosphorylase
VTPADIALDDVWRLVYDGFEPALEGRREALLTLGNGYMGTRGAASEARAGGAHYPGTYLAGCYNRLISDVGGREVEDEHLVNAPNWLLCEFRAADAAWVVPSAADLIGYRSVLDLRRGLLIREMDYRDEAGRVTSVQQQRLVSMAHRHLAAMRTVFTPQNWSGRLTVRSGLDGDVVNGNVVEYRLLANRHLRGVSAGVRGDDVVVLEVVTTQSGLRIAQAARTQVEQRPAPHRRLVTSGTAYIGHEMDLDVTQGRGAVVEKIVAVVTSRDVATSSPQLGALDELARAVDFTAVEADHAAAWERLWGRFAVDLQTDAATRRSINLNLFHVLQTLSPHLRDMDAGVPARGLHGEGYRGHVFWDELFVFPMLTLRLPQLSRALLLYRYRRLDAARDAARAIGREGAMFPWQSGSDGREETPTQLYNLRSGTWMADNSRLQRHVGLAVAYSVWQYYQATADLEFLTEYGAEMMLEVARFFASVATYDELADRFSISGVMGPDEYHDAEFGSDAPGLRDNAYTNVMAAWLFGKAIEVLAAVAGHEGLELQRRLGVRSDEIARWEHLSRRLRVPFHADGVISQFEGYEQLADLDWESYRARYGNIGRLDLILHAEGDTTNRYRLAKQADVLMLFYLLSAEELRGVFGRLGYPLHGEVVERTVDFYTGRVAHGSTLCRVVHAWVLARADRERSWPWFGEALRADLDDTQGGTTQEGIHLAAMAGTVDLVLRGYTGLEIRDDALWLNPRLPTEIARIRFDVSYRGHRVSVTVDHGQVQLTMAACAAAPVQIRVGGIARLAQAGQTLEFPLTADLLS